MWTILQKKKLFCQNILKASAKSSFSCIFYARIIFFVNLKNRLFIIKLSRSAKQNPWNTQFTAKLAADLCSYRLSLNVFGVFDSAQFSWNYFV